MYSTDYYQRLTLESWFTNLEQMPLHRSQQLPASCTNDLLTESSKTTCICNCSEMELDDIEDNTILNQVVKVFRLYDAIVSSGLSRTCRCGIWRWQGSVWYCPAIWDKWFPCQEVHCNCPIGKGLYKSSSILIWNLEKGATALGKQNKFASCLSKGQAEMQVFLSPGWDIAIILITNHWNWNCFSWIYFFENFLHLLFTPFLSLKCAALLPQCWAMRIHL